MRTTLFFICIFYFFCSYSQKSIDTLSNGIIIENDFPLKDTLTSPPDLLDHTPFNKKSLYDNFAIKFKILPWIGIPSGSGLNISAGFEYGFKKNNSLGIDLYFNSYSFSRGDVYDSIKNEYHGKPRIQELDKAIFINYRHYLSNPEFRKKNDVAFYLGSFIRYGQISFVPDKGYKSDKEPLKEIHYSTGMFFGLVSVLNTYRQNKNNIMLDTYFGVFIKQKDNLYKVTDSQNNIYKVNEKPVNVGVRIGLTFSFTFRR